LIKKELLLEALFLPIDIDAHPPTFE